MNVLEIGNLSQSYGGLKVLENVSFSLKAREKVALIGPNGAGKTTLLNVITGMTPPLGGKIYINGQEATKLRPNNRITLGLARSFQLNTLFAHLSLLNNILLAIQGRKNSYLKMFMPTSTNKNALAMAQQLIEAVNFWDKRDIPVNNLSYGEQRQVEVLLALASEPKVLLLDEPSAGLSTSETSNLIDIIRHIGEEAAILFSAHDMDLVFEFSDRVIVLYYGKIIAEGIPDEIRVNPKVKEIYLGTKGRHA